MVFKIKNNYHSTFRLLTTVYIYIRNIKTKVGIQKQYHYSIMAYRDLPST